MDIVPGDPMAVLARSAKLRLFVMLRRTVDPSRLSAVLAQHLNWMIAAERSGIVVMSGPMAHAGPIGSDPVTQLAGLTLLRAADLEAATAFARTDPFVEAGIVAFELFDWTVNEGGLTVTLTLSDSTVTFR